MKCENIPLLEFLRGELPSAQEASTTDHLSSCLTCRERLQVMAALEVVLESRSRRFSRLWLPIAASVVFLLALPLFWHRLQPEPWAELATRQPYPYFPLITRGDERPEATERREAFSAYAAGDYRQALARLERLEEDDEVLFFRGVCQYLLDQPQQALRSFEQAAAQNPRWLPPTLWYRAHLALKMNRPQESKQWLRELTLLESEYRQPAAELLRRLEELD